MLLFCRKTEEQGGGGGYRVSGRVSADDDVVNTILLHRPRGTHHRRCRWKQYKQ